MSRKVFGAKVSAYPKSDLCPFGQGAPQPAQLVETNAKSRKMTSLFFRHIHRVDIAADGDGGWRAELPVEQQRRDEQRGSNA